MSKSYTTEQLITTVRRIGAFNDVSSEGKEDSDIIDVLDIVMLDELLPAIVRLQEEYLVRTVDVTSTANQEFLQVPKRSVANGLRDIYFVDGTVQRYLPMINRENRPFHGQIANEQPIGIYMEGDRIVLVPKSTGGAVFRLSYTFRPSQLVKAADYRKVVTVDSTTSVTVDSTIPTGWSTSSVFDVHSANSGAETRAFDLSASAATGTTVTFTTLIDGSVNSTYAVEVGDYVVLAETAAIPSLPRELHPALAQAAATRLLEADADPVALRIARETLARQIKSFNILAESRIEGKAHKIVNRNSFLTRMTTRGGWMLTLCSLGTYVTQAFSLLV